jgi:hypothetical protein
MEIKDSTKEILKDINILTDNLDGFMIVYLYHHDEKVGKMDFRMEKTKFQKNIKVLTHYKLTDEFMELFKGEKNPIAILSSHVSKMF